MPAADMPEMATQGQEVPPEDLPVDTLGSAEEVPPEDLPTGKDYSTPGQMIATGLEGAAQGVAGPLAPMAETWAGIPKEDIAARAKANPGIHAVSEAGAFGASLLVPGVGQAGLIAKGAEAAAKAAEIGKLGSAAMKAAVEAASFATSDEITKAFLNQPGSDPATPVSAALLHVGAAGLLGAVTGGAFSLGQGMIGKGLESLKNDKVVEATERYIAKLAETGNPLEKISKKISEGITEAGAAGVSAKTGIGIAGYEALKSLLRPTVEKITGKVINKANPYVTDAFIKAITTNEASGLPNAIHYVIKVGQGIQKTTTAIENLFKAGSAQIAPEVSDSVKQDVKDFIEEGQVDQQIKNTMQSEPQPQPGFAHGGQVMEPAPVDHFAMVFPEQNTLLNTAKGRISGYLNGLRPATNTTKLAFDAKPPDADKHRTYNKAIDIAVNPLKILDKVNKGNLTPEDMKHFVGMYPEVHSMLSQKMTERILKAQLSGEKPSYAKRQAMSLFLGAPLDSTLTPVAIQTAQSVFAQKAAAQQMAPTPKKKGTSELGKSSASYQTADQSRSARQQKV